MLAPTSQALIGISVALASFASSSVLLRIYVRKKTAIAIGRDDHFMWAALVRGLREWWLINSILISRNRPPPLVLQLQALSVFL